MAGRVSDKTPEKTVDMRGTPCPLNWVKTKLLLEEMETGAVLAVVVDGGAPARNVPRSVRAEGHEVLEMEATPEGVRVVIEKR